MIKNIADIQRRLPLLAISIILILSACKASSDTLTPTIAPPIQTSAPPTATSVPAAAMVNGEIISLDEFNAELLRFQEAQNTLGKTVPVEEAEERVLNDLIDQLLFAQAARNAGYNLENTDVEARLDALAAEIGGAEALSTWLANHGYTDESFHHSLKKAIESAWMRDNILTNVLSTAEQVHVRQILLYNQETADEVQSRLAAGVAFVDLAAAYDPQTNGELGWFPRGYLLEPKIEEVAFSLEIGQPSEIITTEIGFHIIMVFERDISHPLSPDALLALQEQALIDWLQEEREASKIEK